jgi:hypothetical protein
MFTKFIELRLLSAQKVYVDCLHVSTVEAVDIIDCIIL